MKKFQVLGKHSSIYTKDTTDKDDCECLFGGSKNMEDYLADTLEEANEKAVKLDQENPTYTFFVVEVKSTVKTKVKAEDISIDEV